MKKKHKEKFFDFKFEFDRINNSNYSLVKENTEQKLIHDRVDHSQNYFVNQHAAPEFAKATSRTQMQTKSLALSEKRFLLSERAI
jgi:hypothetical protein